MHRKWGRNLCYKSVLHVMRFDMLYCNVGHKLVHMWQASGNFQKGIQNKSDFIGGGGVRVKEGNFQI